MCITCCCVYCWHPLDHLQSLHLSIPFTFPYQLVLPLYCLLCVLLAGAEIIRMLGGAVLHDLNTPDYHPVSFLSFNHDTPDQVSACSK